MVRPSESRLTCAEVSRGRADWTGGNPECRRRGESANQNKLLQNIYFTDTLNYLFLQVFMAISCICIKDFRYSFGHLTIEDLIILEAI